MRPSVSQALSMLALPPSKLWREDWHNCNVNSPQFYLPNMSLTKENCKRAHVSQTGAALAFWSAFFAPEKQLGTRQPNGFFSS